ncbi:MAG: hypothetical protein IPM29_13400 [Planctomycetes bacterium]|nr:hypothetical protein [Planctomycetota bacterium]
MLRTGSSPFRGADRAADARRGAPRLDCRPAPLRVVGVLLGIVGAGCAGSPTVQIADQRPAVLARTAFDSTVWIGLRTDDRITGYGSAVVLGPRHLLTAAHLWSTTEPWTSSALPAERELVLVDPRAEPAVGHPRQLLRVAFRLAAAGATPPTPDDHAADWVLVECDTPCFDAARAARLPTDDVRTDAAAPLLLAGFSSIFQSGAEPPDTWAGWKPFVVAGPYVIAGPPTTDAGATGLWAPAGWPAPHGHSGGGVYRQDGATAKPELVGIFHGAGRFKVSTTERVAPLGIDAVGWDRVRSDERLALLYTPIEAILHATADRLPARSDAGR